MLDLVGQNPKLLGFLIQWLIYNIHMKKVSFLKQFGQTFCPASILLKWRKVCANIHILKSCKSLHTNMLVVQTCWVHCLDVCDKHSCLCDGLQWEFLSKMCVINKNAFQMSNFIYNQRAIVQNLLNCYMSHPMGKPTICIGETKGADQLRVYRKADQRLCFRYSDSTIPLLLKSEI